MARVTCKVCQSRYESGSEEKTWRNAAREVYACEVCGNVLAEWIGRGIVPDFTVIWRGPRPSNPAAHPAFRPLRRRSRLFGIRQ